MDNLNTENNNYTEVNQDGFTVNEPESGSNVTLSENQGEYVQPKVKGGKEGLWSLIIGLVVTVINCAMGFSLISGGRFFFGGIFIIFPLFGLTRAFAAFKLDGAQKILGIFGLILNGLGTLAAIGFIILGIVSKFL